MKKLGLALGTATAMLALAVVAAMWLPSDNTLEAKR